MLNDTADATLTLGWGRGGRGLERLGERGKGPGESNHNGERGKRVHMKLWKTG